MPIAERSNESFELIWAKWMALDDLDSVARIHVEQRQPFLSFVEAYVQEIINQEGRRSAVRVLEIGCGTAIDSLYLANRQGGHFFATDLSMRALRVARRLQYGFSRPIQLIACDIRAMGFADESFDLVFSQGVLEHFPDPSPIVREQARVTRRGGLVIVDVPQKYNAYTVFKKYKLWKGNWPYGWETQYSVSGLKGLGRRCGLVPYGVGSWGDTTGFLFQQKAKALIGLDKTMRLYFRLLNSLAPRLAPYYRQNVTVCFKRPHL